MDLFEAIKERRSVRKYLKKPVEQEKILKIIEAAHAAPNSGNLQAWRFIIVKDQAKKTMLAQACHEQVWIENAPVIIVIVANVDILKRMYAVRGERLYAVQDCAAAATNALLAIQVLGLSSCWVGSFDEGEVRRILDIPESSRPQVILPIGYPDEYPPTPAKIELRRVVFFGKYGKLEFPKSAKTLDEKYEKARKKIKEGLKQIKETFKKEE